MTIEEIEELCEELFCDRRIDAARLQAGGFSFDSNAGSYQKEIPILEGEFILSLRITALSNKEQEITRAVPQWQVVEADSRQPYEMVRVSTAAGAYVSQVRAAVATILQEVAEAYFYLSRQRGGQSQLLWQWIGEELASEPAFLWEKHPQFAVFRLENGKWFAISMEVEREKLGLAGSGRIAVINVKAKPEDIQNGITRNGFLPAYHMNKKHWISIILDGRLADEEIQTWIRTSYELVSGKKLRKEMD
ncbi:MAG: MmcQ/YjbR family DNA-binding protein [Eubacteriales bacterium]|nr:MmcQ/YjbR family DNA-binding protein [Eubacteriales bacterium]